MTKKLKKILAVLLTLSMVMSMVSITSLAAGEEGTETRFAYCGKEEHTHSIENGCYELTCGKEEGEGAVEGHTHTEDCYTIETSETPVCGQEEAEAAEGHSHTDDCYEKVEVPGEYTCENTEEDHVHDENCPRAESTWTRGKLICDQEEAEAVEGHSHTEACYQVKTLTCDKEETEAVEGHHHTNDCYDTTTTICEFTEEHTHTEACYFEAAFDFETGTLTVNGSGELTWETMDSFRFADETGKSWMLNIPGVNKLGENGTTAGVLNNEVKKVVIGDGITAIGERALGGSGSTHGSSSISRSLIYVEELVLPEGLLTIGKSAFTMMGQNAVNGLFQVNFPSSLEQIGEMAFSQCKTLPKELTIAAPDVVIEGSAFWSCTSIETLIIDGAKKLDGFAFDSCSGLTTVELKKVVTVGDGRYPVFNSGNPKLETLILTEVGEVKPYAFNGYYSDWSNLKHLTVNGSDTVKTKIDDYAFYHNYNLVNVTMNNVESIGKLAFYGAGRLDTVTLTNIGTIGEQAFYGYKEITKWSQLKNVTIDGCETIGKQAFANCYYVTSLDLDNIGIIGQDSFYYNGLLESVTMGQVGTISQYAFRNCGKLTTIDSLKDVGRIDGFAFYGCANLSGLTVEDLTKMGFNGNYGDVMDRVQKILAGEFKLDAAPGIVDITVDIPEEGWEDGKTAQSDNWNTYDNGTQLVEQARWTNEDKTEAEVKVDAYYTAPRQMDYIFVADLSASMAQLGNAADMNSRFYDMQSKLLDMTNELLTSGEVYDCRVAIVTFGGALDASNPGTSTVMDFTGDVEAAMAHINSLEPLFENTDYGLGMQKALELAGSNTNRNTVVIFLSDGAPNQNGSGDMNGTTAAAAIKDMGVPIYGVLHSAPADLNNGDPRYQYHTNAMNAMQAVCSAPTDEVPVTVFEATDTESFGKAMNDAFTAIYPDYTVTIPVNEDFENVRDLAVSVTGGEAAYDAGTHTITWTITGMPFTKHTLTYNMSLTQENADRYGDQSYDVNNGNALITDGASVETPVLTRTRNRPYVPPVTRNYTLTIHYVYADGTTARPTVTQSDLAQGNQYSVTSPVIEGYTADILVVEGTMPARNLEFTVVYTAEEDVENTDTPTTESPDITETPAPSENPETQPSETQEPDETEDLGDNDTPLAENPGESEDLGDNDTPLADVPQTGDMLWLWILLAVSSAAGLVWISLEEKKGKRVA